MGCASELINELTGKNNFSFVKDLQQKDGLDVYYYRNYNYIFFQVDTFYCPLCNDKFSESVMKEIKSLQRKSVNSFRFVTQQCNTASESQKIIEKFDKMVQEEEKYLKTLYYKYKCIKTGKEIYLSLYTGGGLTFEKYLYKDRDISLCLDDLTYMNCRNNRNNDNEGKITSDGYFKGIKLLEKSRLLVPIQILKFKLLILSQI